MNPKEFIHDLLAKGMITFSKQEDGTVIYNANVNKMMDAGIELQDFIDVAQTFEVDENI